MKFEIGDRVRATHEVLGVYDWEGEVVRVKVTGVWVSIGVRFDEEYKDVWLHDCGTGDPDNTHRCLWLAPECLTLLPDDPRQGCNVEEWEKLLSENKEVV